jgi:hypothetical protein
LHGRLRSSVALLDATLFLAGPAGGSLSAGQIDEILDCELVVIERHRVRFRHELLAQFLVSEALVRDAADGTALGAALAAPANTNLIDDTLDVERDPQRRWDAIVQLGVSSYLVRALDGGYGAECATYAAGRIRDLLRRAVELTRPGLATFQYRGLLTSPNSSRA